VFVEVEKVESEVGEPVREAAVDRLVEARRGA
jgi:hypothetical protein